MHQRLLAALLVVGLGAPGCGHSQGHSPLIPAVMIGALAVGAVLIYTTSSSEPCPDPVGRCGGGGMFPAPPEQVGH
jgi:hypothetical protein